MHGPTNFPLRETGASSVETACDAGAEGLETVGIGGRVGSFGASGADGAAIMIPWLFGVADPTAESVAEVLRPGAIGGAMVLANGWGEGVFPAGWAGEDALAKGGGSGVFAGACGAERIIGCAGVATASPPSRRRTPVAGGFRDSVMGAGAVTLGTPADEGRRAGSSGGMSKVDASRRTGSRCPRVFRWGGPTGDNTGSD